MPFAPNRYEFTEAGIEALGSLQLSGVYGIFSRKACLCVGTADDIRARLREHMVAPRIQERQPTYFLLALDPPNGPINALEELIQEYRPIAQ